MAKLIISVGLPASGKTLEANRWVAEDVANRVRAPRDDLRRMFHGRWLGTREQENQVTLMQHAGVRALLMGGVDVFVDDTNLRSDVRANWRKMASDVGAEFEVRDRTHVPLALCLSRNAARPDDTRVNPDHMHIMWKKHILPLGGKPIVEAEPWLLKD